MGQDTLSHYLCVGITLYVSLTVTQDNKLSVDKLLHGLCANCLVI